jgi:hypothetical protein
MSITSVLLSYFQISFTIDVVAAYFVYDVEYNELFDSKKLGLQFVCFTNTDSFISA